MHDVIFNIAKSVRRIDDPVGHIYRCLPFVGIPHPLTLQRLQRVCLYTSSSQLRVKKVLSLKSYSIICADMLV